MSDTLDALLEHLQHGVGWDETRLNDKQEMKDLLESVDNRSEVRLRILSSVPFGSTLEMHSQNYHEQPSQLQQ